jgi:L-fucose isomerase-like protein
MKARLIPMYFDPGLDGDFDRQLQTLQSLLGDKVEFLEPVPLGAELPEAEAVVFPQLLGEAYRRLDDFRRIPLPLLILTSEFGTISMWDWEIMSYLRDEGIATVGPYNLEQTEKVCRALAVKRELKGTKFLVFQDNPGEGFQASIFKRFYWWEDESVARLVERFGISIVKKSFKELGAKAQQIPDSEAEAVWEKWKERLPLGDISLRARNSALKIYIAVKDELEQDDSIRSVGINCLNESRFSDTTPCLAWNMLYEERGLLWGCEADTMTMATKYVLHHSLDIPIMMTNLYPFLMGQAALKHERIPYFPAVKDNPDDYILAAHCGYFGVVPQSFSTQWSLEKKVLAIVNDNATAINARMPEGGCTLAKLLPSASALSVAEGDLTTFAQFENSDCLNGAVIKVNDGHRMLREIASHHYLLMTGHNLVDIQMIAPIFGLDIQVL